MAKNPPELLLMCQRCNDALGIQLKLDGMKRLSIEEAIPNILRRAAFQLSREQLAALFRFCREHAMHQLLVDAAYVLEADTNIH